MFRESSAIDSERTAASVRKLYTKYADNENWFNGTPDSVDRRILEAKKISNLCKAASVRLAGRNAGSQYIALAAEMDSDRTALEGLRRDLLTAAADRDEEEEKTAPWGERVCKACGGWKDSGGCVCDIKNKESRRHAERYDHPDWEWDGHMNTPKERGGDVDPEEYRRVLEEYMPELVHANNRHASVRLADSYTSAEPNPGTAPQGNFNPGIQIDTSHAGTEDSKPMLDGDISLGVDGFGNPGGPGPARFSNPPMLGGGGQFGDASTDHHSEMIGPGGATPPVLNPPKTSMRSEARHFIAEQECDNLRELTIRARNYAERIASTLPAHQARTVVASFVQAVRREAERNYSPQHYKEYAHRNGLNPGDKLTADRYAREHGVPLEVADSYADRHPVRGAARTAATQDFPAELLFTEW